MRIQIFGDETKPKLLALHPMLADGAGMVQLAGHLREDYCIVAPDLSGQGEDTGEFESAEKEADVLFACLKQREWLEYSLIYGASLGAAVGMKLLAKPGLKVGTVVFDGCPLFENAPVLSWMMTQMYVKKQRKAKKVPELARRRMTALYGPVFGPAMAKSFVTMSENSLRAIVASCSECEFVSYPKELEKRMFFEYGGKGF